MLLPISNTAAVFAGLAILVVVVHLTTIYLHRAITHGTVRYVPWLESLMHPVLVILTSINPREWSAVHNSHHLFPDRPGEPGDPHSPHLEGLWHIVFFNVYYYRKGARDKRVASHPFVQARLATIPRRRIDNIGVWGPLGAWVAGMLIFGFVPGLIAGLVYAVPYLLLNGAINGIGHAWGYKNFHSAAGHNSRVLALLTGGEGLHNNHHGRFTTAFFAYRPVEWMFESGGLTIRLLCRLGLAEISTSVRAENAA
jgi:stearoyl-CoA desaturase (delta-9 desaturase)